MSEIAKKVMGELVAKRKIEFITCESGDWEVIRINGGRDFNDEGHSLRLMHFKRLLEYLGFEVEERELTDEEMEGGDY